MKDMYTQLAGFFENCSMAIITDNNEKNENFIASMADWVKLFLEEPEYLKTSASIDIMMNIDIEKYSSYKIKNGSAIHPTNSQKTVTDNLINFIVKEIHNGEVALLSSLCQRRFGYVMQLISNSDGNELVSSLLQTALAHKESWLGLLAIRVAALQPDIRIAKGTGYSQRHVELLGEIRTKQWLIKNGGPSIKRHLVSNDLGM